MYYSFDDGGVEAKTRDDAVTNTHGRSFPTTNKTIIYPPPGPENFLPPLLLSFPYSLTDHLSNTFLIVQF